MIKIGLYSIGISSVLKNEYEKSISQVQKRNTGKLRENIVIINFQIKEDI